MGFDQTRDSGHILSTRYCWIDPFHHRNDNCYCRRSYAAAILFFDFGDQKRSSTHYTWRLPLCATSNLPGSPHGVYWHTGVCIEFVRFLDHVGPDPDSAQQDQDGGENVDR